MEISWKMPQSALPQYGPIHLICPCCLLYTPPKEVLPTLLWACLTRSLCPHGPEWKFTTPVSANWCSNISANPLEGKGKCSEPKDIFWKSHLLYIYGGPIICVVDGILIVLQIKSQCTISEHKEYPFWENINWICDKERKIFFHLKRPLHSFCNA